MQRLPIGAWLLIHVLAPPVAAQGRAIPFEDAGFGLRLTLPPRFKQLPVEKDRCHVLAHFMATRGYPVRDLPYLYRATIRVLRFPSAPVKEPPTSSPTSKPTGNPTGNPTSNPTGNPTGAPVIASLDYPDLRHPDYRSYLLANLPGTLTLSDSKPIRLGDNAATAVEAACVADGREFHIVAYLIDRGSDRFVVEALYMPIHRKKVEAALLTSLRSFRLFEPKAALRREALPQPEWRIAHKAWSERGAAAREAIRRRYELVLHQRQREALLPGWVVADTDACLIVADAPERYVHSLRQVMPQLRRLFDELFGGISDEFVLRPVLRVFRDQIEYEYYRARSRKDGNYAPLVDEVCIVARSLGQQHGQLADAFAGLLQHYLDSKGNHLHRHLPAWLDEGLREYLRWARPAGGKIEFLPSAEELNEMRDSRRQKRRLTMFDILAHRNGALKEEDAGLRLQRGRLVRFMVEHGDADLRRWLATYAKAVVRWMPQHFVPLPPPGALTIEGKAAEDQKKRDDEIRAALRDAVNADVMVWPARRQAELQAAYDKGNVGL